MVAMPTVTVSEGTNAVLDCMASGTPTPSVSWFFNSVPLPNAGNPRVQLAPGNNSLLISFVQASDEGGYLCRASNSAGTESATIQLVVHGMCEKSKI